MVGPIFIDIDPTIARLGHYSLRWYGLFINLAIVAAFVVALREARRKGVAEDDVYGLGAWAVLGGFVGARLLHVIDRWPEYLAQPSAIFAIQNGGLAIYGAILGGVAAGALYARRHGLSIGRMADLAAPGIVLGQAIGRIGCLIQGDALGAPTSLPWGVVYLNPEAMAPSLGVAYHPTPAYELIGDILIFAMLWGLRKRLKTEGALFLMYLTLYSTLKFTVTLVRQEVLWLAGLQEAQVVSLVGGLASLGLLIYLSKRQLREVDCGR
ncbi:MAG: prolipoprotein diacylglyceryl transferase [Chloroflexi bacterium]|nr:prolipoprotein diacylglyceryl transferase [Chloroflexota bacterium]